MNMNENNQNFTNKIDKNGKFFRFADIFVYLLVLIFLISSFVFVYGCKNEQPVDGFIVERNGRQVLVYTYGVGANVNRGYEVNATVNGNKITIEFDGHYNVLTINEEEKSVAVTDANCSTHDCVTAGKMTDKGVIVCLPHGIKILPLNSDELIIGGINENSN